MSTAPAINPHDLVTATALRIARAGYHAPLRSHLNDPRARHRARLTTALTAAAPFIVADYLTPLVEYLDHCLWPLYMAAHAEKQRAGRTPLFHQHLGGHRAYQHAATLLDHRAIVLSGHSWPRRVAELDYLRSL